MANIPYGYRIINGKAEIVEQEAAKIHALYQYYLDGCSIHDAGLSAGIQRSTSGLKTILGNQIYLGDEYYPPLMDKESFERVKQERDRRAEKLGLTKRSSPFVTVPIRTSFHYTEPHLPHTLNASQRAQEKYRHIISRTDQQPV